MSLGLLWCFLSCLLWSVTTFSVIKSHGNCHFAFKSIGICFIMLYSRTKKKKILRKTQCFLQMHVWWMFFGKSNANPRNFDSSIISWHSKIAFYSSGTFSKSAQSHKFVFLSLLTLTELHKRKKGPLFANKMLADKRRHMKSKNHWFKLYSTVWICSLQCFPDLLGQQVWNSEGLVGQSWLHLNTPISLRKCISFIEENHEDN